MQTVKKFVNKIGSAIRAYKKEGPTQFKRPSFLMLMINKFFVIIPIWSRKSEKNKSFVLLSIILAFGVIITNTLMEHIFGESNIATAVKDFISIAAGLIGLFGYMQSGQ